MNLIEKLDQGPILCAEGYLFAMERRGYLQAGAYVPEVVLEHPEVVTQLHREFIRAGSDVVQAFTYYGHREKLRLIGKEELLEPLQKNALKIAKDAAAEFPELDFCRGLVSQIQSFFSFSQMIFPKLFCELMLMNVGRSATNYTKISRSSDMALTEKGVSKTFWTSFVGPGTSH